MHALDNDTIVFYVDDLLIFTKDVTMIKTFKHLLVSLSNLKELGKSGNIFRNGDVLVATVNARLESKSSHHRAAGYARKDRHKKNRIHMNPSEHVSDNNKALEREETREYRGITESLLCFAIMPRFDIAIAASI